ncbi:MAG TPA: (2Fe-2S)-binding protein [Candidatus Binatia bacterium]|nr:(2Fe-2S)-binding protein [Candidatus Binatia bacterium]
MPEIPRVRVSAKINGRQCSREVEPRTLLVQLLREELNLTGTHIGCDTSYCGACTVLLNGRAVKSCTMFAFQADGAEVLTVEGLARDGALAPVQQAFSDCHAFQCGYCTPGLLMSTIELLREHPNPTESAIRKGIAGNTCRCTGYQNIFRAIEAAARSAAARDQAADSRPDRS